MEFKDLKNNRERVVYVGGIAAIVFAPLILACVLILIGAILGR